MSRATKITQAELSEIANREGMFSMKLMELAVDDGIIINASDFNGPGQQAPEWLHLAGSVADFETYVRRLAVGSR